ncbi:MAG: polysaccharide deacetylase family protein [Chitinophagales bacterium]|jgi:peptidoglycan/xylan/chitin deacetylase (PgdA/CDA1 family)|nr:polysaccharide deacetylase family protein [Chitinophagales bacterium]
MRLVYLSLSYLADFLYLLTKRTVIFFGNQPNVVHLTFDDGPSEYLDEVLEMLDRYDQKATFFLLLSQIIQFPDAAQKIYQRGHQIANHGVTHDKYDFFCSKGQYESQFLPFEAQYPTALYRPAYGRISFFDLWKISKKATIVFYSLVLQDWRKDIKKERIMSKINKIKPKDIILLHDNEKSIENIRIYLPILLEYLAQKSLKSLPIY